MENVVVSAALLVALGLSGVFGLLIRLWPSEIVVSARRNGATSNPRPRPGRAFAPPSPRSTPPPRNDAPAGRTPAEERTQLRQLAARLSRLESALTTGAAALDPEPGTSGASGCDAALPRRVRSFASAGMDADSLARRLGVSRGEIELALKMTRNPDGRDPSESEG
jgi:hypothetical protein